jgi:hypothetical protein
VQSTLPTISAKVAIIDGYSQPGANKNTLAQGDNAKLKIAIDGSKFFGNGLTVGQQGSKVLGLDIENCVKVGVQITAGGNVQVAGCFIGTDPTGELTEANGTCVELDNSSNLIGGSNVGDRNVLSGSGNSVTFSWTHDGVYVLATANNPLGITPSGNVIENNIIGLDVSTHRHTLWHDHVSEEERLVRLRGLLRSYIPVRNRPDVRAGHTDHDWR